MELRALSRGEVSFFKSVVAFCPFICNLRSIKKKLLGNKNVSSTCLGKGDPLQAAAERWHLGWAGVVLATLHAWNSSCVRAEQPGLPPSFAGLI